MKLKRRDFLKEGALVAATGFGLGACRREKTKGEVLSELVRDVVVPDVRSAVAARIVAEVTKKTGGTLR